MEGSAFFGVYDEMRKICGYSKKAVKKLRLSFKESKNQTKINKVMKTQENSIKFIDYSEKAFVVAGETKPIKEKLKSAKGRFNPFLKDEKGENYPGWVFSKKREKEVKEMLNI